MREPVAVDQSENPTTFFHQVSIGSAHEQPDLLPSSWYRLVDQLAQGGMGVIYRAIDTVLDQEVAVKVLQSKYADNPDAVRRFLEEAMITGQLQHPGVPDVHDLGTLPDVGHFLAMKLIKGRTLESRLADPSPKGENFVAIFEQICQTGGYAHAHSVIHRDLKPANIMVGAFGEVQVMDWGSPSIGLIRTLSLPTPSPIRKPRSPQLRSAPLTVPVRPPPSTARCWAHRLSCPRTGRRRDREDRRMGGCFRSRSDSLRRAYRPTSLCLRRYRDCHIDGRKGQARSLHGQTRPLWRRYGSGRTLQAVPIFRARKPTAERGRSGQRCGSLEGGGRTARPRRRVGVSRGMG